MADGTEQKPAGSDAMTLDRPIALHRQGQHDQAIQAYSDILRDDPGQPRVWVNLGVVLRKLFGIGTARTLQDAEGLALRVQIAWLVVLSYLRRSTSPSDPSTENHIPRAQFAMVI